MDGRERNAQSTSRRWSFVGGNGRSEVSNSKRITVAFGTKAAAYAATDGEAGTDVSGKSK